METPSEDLVTEDEVYEIYTGPDADFRETKDVLTDKGYVFLSAEEEMVPGSYTQITDEESREKMQKLLMMLCLLYTSRCV